MLFHAKIYLFTFSAVCFLSSSSQRLILIYEIELFHNSNQPCFAVDSFLQSCKSSLKRNHGCSKPHILPPQELQEKCWQVYIYTIKLNAFNNSFYSVSLIQCFIYFFLLFLRIGQGELVEQLELRGNWSRSLKRLMTIFKRYSTQYQELKK